MEIGFQTVFKQGNKLFQSLGAATENAQSPLSFLFNHLVSRTFDQRT